MTKKKRNPREEKEGVPKKDAVHMKNPSPIGTQQNPVSNPREATNPVEEELEEREKFRREHGIELDKN